MGKRQQDLLARIIHDSSRVAEIEEAFLAGYDVAPPPPAILAGMALVPVEPTEVMYEAARDWSVCVYGIGIGDKAAQGCWKAMIEAARSEPKP
jgi:hypothetical protein